LLKQQLAPFARRLGLSSPSGGWRGSGDSDGSVVGDQWASGRSVLDDPAGGEPLAARVASASAPQPRYAEGDDAGRFGPEEARAIAVTPGSVPEVARQRADSALRTKQPARRDAPITSPLLRSHGAYRVASLGHEPSMAFRVAPRSERAASGASTERTPLGPRTALSPLSVVGASPAKLPSVEPARVVRRASSLEPNVVRPPALGSGTGVVTAPAVETSAAGHPFSLPPSIESSWPADGRAEAPRAELGSSELLEERLADVLEQCLIEAGIDPS